MSSSMLVASSSSAGTTSSLNMAASTRWRFVVGAVTAQAAAADTGAAAADGIAGAAVVDAGVQAADVAAAAAGAQAADVAAAVAGAQAADVAGDGAADAGVQAADVIAGADAAEADAAAKAWLVFGTVKPDGTGPGAVVGDSTPSGAGGMEKEVPRRSWKAMRFTPLPRRCRGQPASTTHQALRSVSCGT